MLLRSTLVWLGILAAAIGNGGIRVRWLIPSFGAPWSRLLADYDVFRGRVWILVLITTTLAPLLVAYGCGLVPDL